MRSHLKFLVSLLFSLFIHSLGQGQCDAIPIECGGYQGGSSFFYSTIGENNDFNINDYECYSSGAAFDAPDIVFEFIKQDFSPTYITLFNYNTDLDLFLLDVCSSEIRNCIDYSVFGYGELFFNLNIDYLFIDQPGTYYIVVDGYDVDQVDDFYLNISCDEFWDCDNNRILYCDDIYNGSTCSSGLNYTSKNNAYSCEDYPLWTGWEDVYRYEAEQDGIHKFDAYNLTGDIDLFLLDNYDCYNLSGYDCIVSSTEAGTTSESVSLDMYQGQVIYVVLDGWLDECSDYTISVSCSHFDCTNAYPIYCGEYIEDDNYIGNDNVNTYYNPDLAITYSNMFGNEKVYEFIPYQNGNHSFYLSDLNNTNVDLDIFILEQCLSTTVIGTSDGTSNLTEDIATAFLYAGVSYYIVIDGDGTQNSATSSDYTLNVNCPGYCETIPAHCDDIIYGNNYSVNSSSPYPKDFCFYYDNQTFFTKMSGGDAKYSFTPDQTKEYTIELTNVLQGKSLELFVLDICDPLNCIATSYNLQNGADKLITLQLNENQEYLIVVDGENGDESTFELKLSGCKGFLDEICESMTPILVEDFESYIVNSPIDNQSSKWSSVGTNKALIANNSTLLKTKTLDFPNNSDVRVNVASSLYYKTYKIDHDLELFYMPSSNTINVQPNLEMYLLDDSLLDFVKYVSIKLTSNNTAALEYTISGLNGSNTTQVADLGDVFFKGAKVNSRNFRISWIVDANGMVSLYINEQKAASFTMVGGFNGLYYGITVGSSQGNCELDNLCISACHKDGKHACRSKEQIHCNNLENYVSGVEIQNYAGWTTGGLSMGCKVVNSPQGGKALGIKYDNGDCGAEYTINDQTGLDDVIELNYDLNIPSDGGLQSIFNINSVDDYMFFNFVKDELSYQIGDNVFQDYSKVDIPLDQFFKFRIQLNKQNGTVRVYFDDILYTEAINTKVRNLTTLYFDSNLSNSGDYTLIDNICLDKCKECSSYEDPFEAGVLCSNVLIDNIRNVNDLQADYTFNKNDLPENGTWSIQEEDENGYKNIVIQDASGSHFTYGCYKGRKYIICYKYYDEEECEKYCCIKLDLSSNCSGVGIIPYFVGSETNNEFNFEMTGLENGETVSNWFIDDNPIGSNTIVNYTFPSPGQRFICCLVYDPVRHCYRVCCKKYCISNPLNCNWIQATSNDNGKAFNLQLDDNYQSVVWSIDQPSVTNNQIGNNNPQYFDPSLFGISIGQTIVVSAKYIDTNGCEKICCKRITYNPGNGNNGVIFNLPETCITPGQSAEIPINVENFDKVGAFNFKLELPNNSNVRFVNIVNATLQNLTFNVLSDSELIIAWDEQNGNNIDLLDGTRIFNISIEANSNFNSDVQILSNSIAVLSDVHSIASIKGGKICVSRARMAKGTIANELGVSHSNVKVGLYENGQNINSTTTNNLGNYIFDMASDLQVVIPSKNDEIRRGVNVVDVARIRRHFLQKNLLASDYKMVAADVNKDGQINIVDAALVNRVFLQKISSFPNNTSWRFLPGHIDISGNPLNAGWPEFIDLSSSAINWDNLDFVSIKVGDVDNSAFFKQSNGDNKRTTDINLSIPDTTVSTAGNISIPIYTENFIDVSVLSFELNYDTNKLEFISFDQTQLEGFGDGNFNDLGGKILVGWDHPQANGQDVNGYLMNGIFKAKTKEMENTEIAFENLLAYDAAFNELQISGESGVLSFIKTSTSHFESDLAVNLYPNPFTSIINVDVQINKPELIELTFFDIEGKVIKTINSQSRTKDFKITVSEFHHQGIIFCKVKGETFTKIVKLIKI